MNRGVSDVESNPEMGKRAVLSIVVAFLVVWLHGEDNNCLVVCLSLCLLVCLSACLFEEPLRHAFP